MEGSLQLHGNCVARDGAGVLILGPPGSGKSDLTLRLLNRGFDLVADDRVDIRGRRASAPAVLSGLLEVHGFGIVRRSFLSDAILHLIIQLPGRSVRLPTPERHKMLDLPLMHLDPALPSAPERVALALDCVLGRVRQTVGAFAS